ncbi:MAG: hypothetical protein ABIP95_05045 [Pelobium sp.]
MKYLLLLLMMSFFYSCKKKEKVERVEWDFSDKAFKTNQNLPLRMLNSYDVVSIDKLSDSLLVINLEVFKGWKNKPLKFIDTLKLTDNIKILDTLGNQSMQILSYKKKNEIFFQLNLYHQAEMNSYKYDGKLFIESKKLHYYCDHLYIK